MEMEWDDVPLNDLQDFTGIHDGTEPLQLSNAGQEFIDLARGITGDWNKW